MTLVDGVGQVEDLSNGQDRPFGRLLLPSAFDPAGVAADQSVINCGVQYGLEQPVGLSDSDLANVGV